MTKYETGAVSTANALKMAIEYIERCVKGELSFDELSNIAVLNACKEALESQEIGDAEIRQMLNDIEYYQKRVEELESQKQEYDINEMIDKITPENLQEPDYWLGYGLQAYDEKPYDEATPLYLRPAQPLSDDEITNLEADSYFKTSHDTWEFDVYGFARAIEQEHGIGEKDGQAHNSSNEWNISGTRD